jgi:hypothetical protein
MIFHLFFFLLACASLSASAPSTSLDGSLLASGPDHVLFNNSNASSILSYTSEIDPETWRAATAAIASTSDGDPELSVANNDIKSLSSSIDNVKYEVACYNKRNELLLITPDQMYMKVEEIISDVSEYGRSGSTRWGDSLPNDDDIGIYSNIDLWMWEPPVNADLLRDMFQNLVYNWACSTRGWPKTRGGWIVASRRPGNELLARVEIYSEHRGE